MPKTTLLASLFVLSALTVLPSRAVQAQESWSRPHARDLLIDHNPDLARARLMLQSRMSEIRGTDGLFDATVAAELQLRRSVTPVDNEFVSGLSRDSNYGLNLSYARRLVYGTTVNLSWAQAIARSESTLTSAFGAQNTVTGPNFTHGWTLSFTQPLMQGFGRETNLSARGIATAQLNADELSLLQTASAHLGELFAAYAELAIGEQELAMQRRMADRTQRQLDIAQTLLDAGTIAQIELDIVRERQLRVEESILLADLAWRSRSAELRRIVGIDPEDDPITASDPAVLPSSSLNRDALCETVSDLNPAVHALREQVRVAQLYVDDSYEGLRPSLDLTGGILLNGLDENWGTSLGQVFTLDAPTLFAGLLFTMPLGNEAARARNEQAQIAVSSAELEVAITERALCQQVDVFVRQIDGLRERADLAERRVALAQSNLAAEERRLGEGYSTVQQSLDALDNVEQVEVSALRIEADLERAWWQLEQLTGNLAAVWLSEVDVVGAGSAGTP